MLLMHKTRGFTGAKRGHAAVDRRRRAKLTYGATKGCAACLIEVCTIEESVGDSKKGGPYAREKARATVREHDCLGSKRTVPSSRERERKGNSRL